MDQQQVNRILEAIRALDRKVEYVQAELNGRFENIERRLANVESVIVRQAGPNALPAVPAPPSLPAPPSIYQSIPQPPPPVYDSTAAPHGYTPLPPQNVAARPPPRTVGSRENATFLPFALEAIEATSQMTPADDRRKCGKCGGPPFSTECFRKDHFRWCRSHSRPILPPHNQCGRDFSNCVGVRWENRADWEELVQMSYEGGYLGERGVEGLDRILFPRDTYPHKYDSRGWFKG